MIEPSRVRVSFRKQVSDGNYGSEAAEVSLEYEVEAEAEVQSEIAEALFKDARARVHAELERSPSPAVRRALEPPPPLRQFGSTPHPVPAGESEDLEVLPF